MDLRLLTSLNWLIGTLMLGAAALLPLVQQALGVNAARVGAEAKVAEILNQQKQEASLRERFVYFGATPADIQRGGKELNIAIPTNDFVFDASRDGTNALVIRSMTAPEALRSGRLPPMMYRYTVQSFGDPGSGSWVATSGRTPGLQAILGSLLSIF